MKRKILLVTFALAFFAVTAAYAQPYITEDGFVYIDVYNLNIIDGELKSSGHVEIVDYTGSGGAITTPPSLMGTTPSVIGLEAFYNKRLTSVKISEGIRVIKQGAFHTNLLTSITIPNSVTEIGIGAFMFNRLTSVIIGSGVTHIGEVAFHGNPITSITIGANVDFHEDAFPFYEENGNEYPSNFVEFYNAQGRSAGTYTRPNARSTNWTRR
jgi:hypothetical protein